MPSEKALNESNAAPDTRASDLWERCVRGDQTAWGTVYETSLALARLPRWGLGDEAADIAQEVVLKLINGVIETVREPACFLAFVKRMTTTRIIDWMRDQKRKREHFVDEEDGGVEKPPPGWACHPLNPGPYNLGVKQQFEALVRLVGELPIRCQQVLDTYFKYKMEFYASYREIAERLETSVGNAGSLINRCLKNLRELPEYQQLAKEVEP